MHTSLGLRIARVHTPFRSHAHRPFTTLRSIQTRAASTSPATTQTKSQPQSASELISTTHLTTPLPATATLNPPSTTRPPPLDLPLRNPSTSILTHWFRVGKAYTQFYKTGLSAILTNRRLLAASTAARPTALKPSPSYASRADILLRERVRHDLSRLPIFGLLVLICGEFTPLIVLVFPRLTPYTCRIPRQADALRKSSEARRAASFRALRAGRPDGEAVRRLAPGHVCRSLGLTSAVWDRIGLDSPFAGVLARRAVARIAADDAMIREGGGLDALVDEEVVLACEDRGINVRDEPVDGLRSKLKEWLRKTAPERKVEKDTDVKASAQNEAQEKVQALLLGQENI